MQFTMKHGLKFDVVTHSEMRALLAEYTTRQRTRKRVRAGATIILDATGSGTDEIYTVPMGYEFEARRIFLDLGTAVETSLQTATVSLGTVGNSVQYLRSGTRIEWGNPLSPVATAGRVPGVQTWGDQQGPYLQNGETFELRAVLGAAQSGVSLSVLMEGILTQAGSLK